MVTARPRPQGGNFLMLTKSILMFVRIRLALPVRDEGRKIVMR